ncbi:MAG: SIS domain-containing protein [Desulfobacterales bacterium]|nr:SIS domain-containing protein [Desulfobacterales bacterium]
MCTIFFLTLWKYVKFLFGLLRTNVFWCKHLSKMPENAIVFFPCCSSTLCCGFTGIVAIARGSKSVANFDITPLDDAIREVEKYGFSACSNSQAAFKDSYLSGPEQISSFREKVRALKEDSVFIRISRDSILETVLSDTSKRLKYIIATESEQFIKQMGTLDAADVDIMSTRIAILKDIAWCITAEILDNLSRIRKLYPVEYSLVPDSSLAVYKKINAVLNSIDRLEVRGRDSAGISILFTLPVSEYDKFQQKIMDKGLRDEFNERASDNILVNKSIGVNKSDNKKIAVVMTYKVAKEIGNLGDNISFIREQIISDIILQDLACLEHLNYTILSHTRWASVGSINEFNCHPVDNNTTAVNTTGIIHACLNGDIDNYLELKKIYETSSSKIPEEITTDTKIIPVRVTHYLEKGFEIEEAFRLAVSDFTGSHAISMHTDLAPGKLFLAQKGSGQAIFIGLATDHYMPTSEVYGFIEETPSYIKMIGNSDGRILILDQESGNGLNGIKALTYDGTPIELTEKDINYTEISSRDIDRQEFPHFFLKEILESPKSVEKTLQNRWKIDRQYGHHIISLDKTTFPERLEVSLKNNKIKRVFFIGQGTAGIAAQACADILNYYLHNPSMYVKPLKASELSGFILNDKDDSESMSDALVIAISQSGTTTDTNRTIDMVKERGGQTLAIVNRRESDITFKVDGVFYTSSGRDIEMSVASTKAFYAQIVAGAIISLQLSKILNRRSADFISEQIKSLLELPEHMRKVLSMRDKIEASAKKSAVSKTYWAVVGSGPNKASADEIRIKLSELCYKTISTDFVEDKKHIDLSSEPLIIVCAAGARRSVIGDIIKDTAIFHAHKATPIVIANEGEDRFTPYAEAVFNVPLVDEHLAPVLNTLAGHLWGYYAALSINEGSRFLHHAREEIQKSIDEHAKNGLDIYEIVLEKSFREKVAAFYYEFRKKKMANELPTTMGIDATLNLILVMKYLMGRMSVSDFELDFGIKGTAKNLLIILFDNLGDLINSMARPVDAIKHQAKTVTVGTSRISDKLEGILFDKLTEHEVSPSTLSNNNIIVLKNLQGIVSDIKGSIFYKIDNLNLLGEPTDISTIEIIKKSGVLEKIPSRVEKDNRLKGTKRIIVREGNVYIGIGRKDNRTIIVIPIISADPAMPNRIENLLLLNIAFRDEVELAVKIKALGGKYERIKNIVQENSITFEDQFLELVDMKMLFGKSAEKTAEYIVSALS